MVLKALLKFASCCNKGSDVDTVLPSTGEKLHYHSQQNDLTFHTYWDF